MTTITLEGKEYQLDIEQAKQLGLLKEKGNKVRSWEEFKNKYVKKTGYVYSEKLSKVISTKVPFYITDQLTQHEAKALAAFSKLLKLRRDWIRKWEPNWLEPEYKFSITRDSVGVAIDSTYYRARTLAFPTQQMAKDFLETFRDLIEDAKMLI